AGNRSDGTSKSLLLDRLKFAERPTFEFSDSCLFASPCGDCEKVVVRGVKCVGLCLPFSLLGDLFEPGRQVLCFKVEEVSLLQTFVSSCFESPQITRLDCALNIAQGSSFRPAKDRLLR